MTEGQRMNHVAVLGGTGFVGKSLANMLRRTEGVSFNALGSVDINLLNYSETLEWFRYNKPSMVINAAARVGSVHYVDKNRADVLSDNSLMVLNMYRSLAELSSDSRVINLISNCCYPSSEDIQFEGKHDNGPPHGSVSGYANYKRLLINLSQEYEAQYGLKSTNIMFPGIFGPGDSLDANKSHALNGMISRMLKAKMDSDDSFEVWGTGSPVRDWLFVEDAAKSIIRIMNLECTSANPINVTSELEISIADLALLLKDIIGFDGKIEFNPSYADGDPCKILKRGVFDELVPNFCFTQFRTALSTTVESVMKRIT
jgi:GDP-L-fucose synthase